MGNSNELILNESFENLHAGGVDFNSFGSFLAKLDPTSASNWARLDPTDKSNWAQLDPTNPNSEVSKQLANLDPTNPNSDIHKALQQLNTVQLAPFRAIGLLSLNINFMNLATVMKLMQTRRNKQYEAFKLKFWYNLGGNRTKFDNAVGKGWNKKPILGKKMNTEGLSFGGEFYANASTSDPKTLKIPQSVLSLIPVGCTTASQIFAATPADRAASAALWNAWGAVVMSAFEVVNECKIPLGKNETSAQPDVANKPTGMELLDIQRQQAAALKGGIYADSIIKGIPDGAVYGGGAILGLVALYMILK